MKKIVCFVSSMDAGGAETFIMKIYRAIDRTKYQFDFIVSSNQKGLYNDEILSLGGNVFYTPAKSKYFFKNILTTYKILRKHNYEAALRMTSHSLGTIDLLVAKAAGIKKLILRSTNAGNTNTSKVSIFLHKIFRFLPKCVPNIKIAPSILAADFLFGKNSVKNKKVIILNNGIPLDKFLFDDRLRKQTRNNLKINNKFVIGHIGRFNFQKNHKFLIKIFYEINKKFPETVLLFIGKGELENDIKNCVDNLELNEKVLFLGIRKDIPELLMAMDLMLFPSLFEGMPNVLIEAQATGLPCIISDSITKEVLINENIIPLPLTDKDEWINESINFINKPKIDRGVLNNSLKDAGYDIKAVCNNFIEKVFYETIYKKHY